MKTAIITAKIDTEVKALAQKTANDLGVTLSFVIDQLLRRFNQDKRIVVEELIPNEETVKAIEEARADRAAGKTGPIFDNTKDFFEHLDSLK